ncbi:MAG: BamA/TamA family outer membrane protein, partial [Desulfovibrionaceae bacterium]|nr:BamA/TamA family outer membrane protein [Desulfovibrionaceae bacterium]
PLLLADPLAAGRQTEQAAEALLASDAEGKIPAPELPPALVQAAEAYTEFQDAHVSKDPLRYRVICHSPDAPNLAAEFLKSSQISRMQDVPIYTLTALQQRLRTSLEEGRNILHSFGFYAGSVKGWIEKRETSAEPESENADALGADNLQEADGTSSSRLQAVVQFFPGPRYTLGKTRIIRTNQPDLSALPPELLSRLQLSSSEPRSATDAELPRSLEDVGLKHGSPAVAADVLKAVDLVVDAYHNKGYPFAEIYASRYVLDNVRKELEATVVISPSDFICMGPPLIRGDVQNINHDYINYLKNWQEGEPWNQKKIEEFRELLRSSGLFSRIEIKPATHSEESRLSRNSQSSPGAKRPVLVTLKEAPFRTVGASLRYDTSFGPGLQGFWEHRNFTGNGDLLRAELSLWSDLQELTGHYRLPFVYGRDVDFIAQAGALYQDTDAYRLQAAQAAAGFEWRVNRHWNLAAQGSIEGGWIKDPEKQKQEYMMYGLPFSASFSSANSLLDATDGGRAMISIAPYTGFYDNDFNILRSRIDLQRFIPMVGKDTLVLAMRASLGNLLGADAPEVPPSVRFYSGGGGSVRGYKYQSLGPRNSDGDPLGGASLLEMSIEPRYKINDTFGVVAFLDGGMAYENSINADYGKDLRWGAGIGLRLYTAIGPVRFDVGTPLNPRSDDDSLHFYISIGQSF